MPIDDTDSLSFIYVPHDNKVIEAGAEKHVLSNRMPFYVRDTTLVPLQLN